VNDPSVGCGKVWQAWRHEFVTPIPGETHNESFIQNREAGVM